MQNEYFRIFTGDFLCHSIQTETEGIASSNGDFVFTLSFKKVDPIGIVDSFCECLREGKLCLGNG
jgi:hypothetical protein